MTITATDLISGALRVISSLAPGEAVPGDEASSALTVLNAMLASWSAESLMPPFRTPESFSLAAAINSRTIGSGAQFDTVRPDYVTAIYLRDSGNMDYDLDQMTKEEYNAIPLKTNSSRPRRYYYDTQYPNGVIYFDYSTDTAYTAFVESLKPLNQFTALTTSMSLPGEYQEAIKYLLAARLAPEYGATLSPDAAALAMEARKGIMRKNAKAKPAGFDLGLRTGNARRPYNIYTG